MGAAESSVSSFWRRSLRSGGQHGWVLAGALFGVQAAAFSWYPRVGETREGKKLSRDSPRAPIPLGHPSLVTSSKPEPLLPDPIPSTVGLERADFGAAQHSALGLPPARAGSLGVAPPVEARGRMLQAARAGEGGGRPCLLCASVPLRGSCLSFESNSCPDGCWHLPIAHCGTRTVAGPRREQTPPTLRPPQEKASRAGMGRSCGSPGTLSDGAGLRVHGV